MMTRPHRRPTTEVIDSTEFVHDRDRARRSEAPRRRTVNHGGHVHVREVPATSSASLASVAVLNWRDTADFDVERDRSSRASPTGSATKCGGGWPPRQHPLQGDLGQQVPRGEHPIGVKGDLPATVNAHRSRPAHRHRAAAQNDRAGGGTVALGYPAKIVLASRANDPGAFGLHHLGDHDQTSRAAERHQPLPDSAF